MQPPRKDSTPAVHACPVCGREQTKIQRVVGSVTRGSMTYVCARPTDCSIGVDLKKVANWIAV